MLTPHDNYIRFLKNETSQWAPCNLDQLRFMPAMIIENISRGLVAQQVPYIGPLGGPDLFGVDWYYDPSARGSMEKKPLFDVPEDFDNWEAHVSFPDLDTLDWEICAKENREYLHTDKLITTTIYTAFFERLISFLGFADAAVALVDDDMEPAVRRLFNALADFYIDLIGRMNRWFGVEYVVLHDDWGTQNSTIFSAATHRSIIFPYISKVVSGAHSFGVFVEQHSCGKIGSLVPGIIDSGADTWRGQDINDKPALVAQYGGRFKFGVELPPPSGSDTGAAVDTVLEYMRLFKEARVWFSFPRTLTPEQSAAAYHCLVNGGLA